MKVGEDRGVRTSYFPYLTLPVPVYLYLPAAALFSPAPVPYKFGDSKHIFERDKFVTGLHGLLVWFWRSPCVIALQLDF